MAIPACHGERNTRPIGVSRSAKSSVGRPVAPQHERVLDRVRVIGAPDAGHRKSRSARSESRRVVRPAHFERRATGAEPMRAFGQHVVQEAGADAGAAASVSRHDRQVVDVQLVEAPARTSRSRRCAGPRPWPDREYETPWFSSSARYISRVHGLVNDACSIARTASISAGDASGSIDGPIARTRFGSCLRCVAFSRDRFPHRAAGRTAAARPAGSMRPRRARADGHPADGAGEQRRREHVAAPARTRQSCRRTAPPPSPTNIALRRRARPPIASVAGGSPDGRRLDLDEAIGSNRGATGHPDSALQTRRADARPSTRRSRPAAAVALAACASASSADTGDDPAGAVHERQPLDRRDADAQPGERAGARPRRQTDRWPTAGEPVREQRSSSAGSRSACVPHGSPRRSSMTRCSSTSATLPARVVVSSASTRMLIKLAPSHGNYRA